MSLEQQITTLYDTDRKNIEDEVKKLMDSNLPNNCKDVMDNWYCLYSDLHKFAKRFDNIFYMDAELLTEESMDDIYQDIKENFVERIAKEKDNFVYVDSEGETLKKVEKRAKSSAIAKTFGAKYDKLKTDFRNSKNLPDFFVNRSTVFCNAPEHEQMKNDPLFGSGAAEINKSIDEFVGSALSAMADELKKKESKEIILMEKDKKYFYDENDSTYLSQGLRYLFPNWWSVKHQTYDKHTIEPVADDVKIFPTNKSPNQHEVKQAGVGDCYLMAALISLAKTNPQAIKDCFVDGLDKIENKKNITIRFFSKCIRYQSSHYRNKCAIKILVNRDKVIMPQHIKDGALWPKIIEKAYAIYRTEGYDGSIKGKNLDGGSPATALFAITGKDSKKVIVDSYHPPGEKVTTTETVIDKIRKILQSGRSLTCNFKKIFYIKDAKTGENIKILIGHVYAIVGINDEKEYIRLIEPNKLMGRSAESNHKNSKEGGHIAIKFDNFKEYVDSINYTGKK